MKKISFNLIIATGMVLLSIPSQAQQVTQAKPPAVTGPVIQPPTENKTPAPAQVTDKDLHQTATKQSSVVNEPKLVKGKDIEKSAAPVQTQPLPQTNTLVPPNNIKNR